MVQGFMRSGGGLRSHNHSSAVYGGTILQPLHYRWPAATELTIAAGQIAATRSHHTIDTQGDAATDDLDFINNLVANQWYLFRPESSNRTVIVKHATGNIWCIGNADYTLDDSWDYMLVFCPGGGVAYAFFPGAGGGGGHVIQEEGAPLAQRAGLNFIGPLVKATDDAVNNRTNVTVIPITDSAFQM